MTKTPAERAAEDVRNDILFVVKHIAGACKWESISVKEIELPMVVDRIQLAINEETAELRKTLVIARKALGAPIAYPIAQDALHAINAQLANRPEEKP